MTLDLVVEAPNEDEAYYLAEYIAASVEPMWQSAANTAGAPVSRVVGAFIGEVEEEPERHD